MRTVPEADHYNFSDLSILNPTANMMVKIDGHRMLIILNNYTSAFFDKHLRGIETAFLDGSTSDYPEIKLSKRSAER